MDTGSTKSGIVKAIKIIRTEKICSISPNVGTENSGPKKPHRKKVSREEQP